MDNDILRGLERGCREAGEVLIRKADEYKRRRLAQDAASLMRAAKAAEDSQ